MDALERPEDRDLIAAVKTAGQGHVFRWWPQLSAEQRVRLLDQLGRIDFQLLARLQEECLRPGAGRQSIDTEDLLPAEAVDLFSPGDAAGREETRQAGEEAVRSGQVAALVVAGGQGTRLGFDGPKGAFPFGALSGKTLFLGFAEQILAASRRYGDTILWYVMTSRTNDADTRAFFEGHNYFGLPADSVSFFCQGELPATDSEGRLILQAPDEIAFSPDGHGGMLEALHRSGCLDDLASRGVQVISYFQVDNPLVRVIDPPAIGHHLAARSEMTLKVLEKRDPEEGLGVITTRRGRPAVIEYSDLPDKLKYARREGKLLFSLGSIAIHLFDVAFLRRVGPDPGLPYHLARKRVPYVDDSGLTITPARLAEPNGRKFERFIFDLLPLTRSWLALKTRREDEFAPVKNAPGAPFDTLALAQRAMTDRCGRWLEAAGVKIPRDEDGHVIGKVEISPQFALDQVELAGKIDPNLTFRGKLLLSNPT